MVAYLWLDLMSKVLVWVVSWADKGVSWADKGDYKPTLDTLVVSLLLDLF